MRFFYIFSILFIITSNCIAEIKFTINKRNWQEWLTIDYNKNDNNKCTTLDIYIVPSCFHCANFLQSEEMDSFRKQYEEVINIRVNYIITNASDVLLITFFANNSEIQKEMMFKITAFMSEIEEEYYEMQGQQLERIKLLITKKQKLQYDINQFLEQSKIEELIAASAKKAKNISALFNIKEFDTPFFIINGKKYEDFDDVKKYIKSLNTISHNEQAK